MNKTVFLVGAGRSGTTLLYKLLALHPEIAVVTNYDSKLLDISPSALFMRLIRNQPRLKKSFWFGKGGMAYFRPGMEKLFPYPVEGEPLYRLSGVPLVMDSAQPPPESAALELARRFTRLLSWHGGSVFLSKRTANNRRLSWLRTAFPEAYYVNLLRDGREVAYSLSVVDWWDKHKVWWAGLTAEEMESEGWDRLHICAKNWVEEVSAVEAGLEGLPEERLYDLRYEQLLKDPIPVIRSLLAFLGLDAAEAYLDVLRSLDLREMSPKWRSAWSGDQLGRVEEIEQELLTKYGYV